MRDDGMRSPPFFHTDQNALSRGATGQGRMCLTERGTPLGSGACILERASGMVLEKPGMWCTQLNSVVALLRPDLMMESSLRILLSNGHGALFFPQAPNNCQVVDF